MLKISIIIPTINRYGDLRNTIKDLNKQSVTDFEIIIIDQTDESVSKTITGGNIIYLHKDFKSASKARNVGLLLAKAPIALFLDDDVIINNRDFLKNHLRHFENQKTSGVAGAILKLDEKWVNILPSKESKKYLGWLYFPINYSYPSTVKGGISANLAVRKDWAIDIGGMDENYDKGAHREESDFCLRYTNKFGNLMFDPETSLIHIGNPEGGSRNWSNSNGIIHAKQHMIGSWYFMLCNLPIISWLEYSYYNTRRFIVHKKLFYRFYLLPIAILRFTSSFFIALKLKIKGPKFIKIDHQSYSVKN